MANITVITYPDLVHNDSRKFLLISPFTENINVFIDAIAIMNDPDDYTIYHWDILQDPIEEVAEKDWVLKAAGQAEKIYINLQHGDFMKHFLFGWKNTYWFFSGENFRELNEFYKKINPRYVSSPIDLLVNT